MGLGREVSAAAVHFFSYLRFLLAEKTCGEVRALQEGEMVLLKQQKGGGVMWKLSWVFQERSWSGLMLCWCFNPCGKTQVCGSDGSSAGRCWDVWDVQCLPAFIPKIKPKITGGDQEQCEGSGGKDLNLGKPSMALVLSWLINGKSAWCEDASTLEVNLLKVLFPGSQRLDQNLFNIYFSVFMCFES